MYAMRNLFSNDHVSIIFNELETETMNLIMIRIIFLSCHLYDMYRLYYMVEPITRHIHLLLKSIIAINSSNKSCRS